MKEGKEEKEQWTSVRETEMKWEHSKKGIFFVYNMCCIPFWLRCNIITRIIPSLWIQIQQTNTKGIRRSNFIQNTSISIKHAE